jgi:hypothetical protein
MPHQFRHVVLLERHDTRLTLFWALTSIEQVERIGSDKPTFHELVKGGLDKPHDISLGVARPARPADGLLER